MIMVGNLDTVQTITGGVIAFFVLIALITVIRVILNREDSAWYGMRVGFFIERDRPEPDEPAEGGPGVSETGRDR